MVNQNKSFYELIPRHYRFLDTKQGEPLRALASIIQSQLSDVVTNIEQLYDDWYIQTCNPWVVPYIGELLGIHLNNQTYFLPNQRAWVANSMRYRRSKGVAFALQPQIWDATGWYARVIQRFPYLCQTQNLIAMKPDQGRSINMRTLAADNWLNSPFDQVAHRPGFGSPFTIEASYNLSTIAVYIWRILNYLVAKVPPRLESETVDTGASNRFHFNPLGFDIPLFDFPEGAIPADRATSAKNLPAPINSLAFSTDLEAFRRDNQMANRLDLPSNTTYFGPERALNITVLEKQEFSEDAARRDINPIAIYPMAMPFWDRPPADTLLSFAQMPAFPQDLPATPAVSISFGAYGPYLAQFPNQPENWEQVANDLAYAIQNATVLDKALTGMIVCPVAAQLLFVPGFSSNPVHFQPTDLDPLVLQQFHLEPQDYRTAFLSGNLTTPLQLSAEEPSLKISSLDYPIVIANLAQNQFDTTADLASTLQTAIRNATPDIQSLKAALVFASGTRLQVFSGTHDFPQFYQGLADAETVAELGLQSGHGSLLEQMNNPNLDLLFEKVILSGQLLPGEVVITEPASFYFSLNNQAAQVNFSAMTIDSPATLENAAAELQTAIRDAEYDNTRPFAYVEVRAFQDTRLLIKAPRVTDQLSIYPSESDAANKLQLLEGERAVLASAPLGKTVNLSQPTPQMELVFLNSPIVNLSLAPMRQPIELEEMAQRLQTAINHAAILDDLFCKTQVLAASEDAVVVIPGLKSVRYQFSGTSEDPTSVAQLKLGDAVDFHPRITISGPLTPDDFPINLSPMADVLVAIDPNLPADAILNPSDEFNELYDLRDTASRLQSAMQEDEQLADKRPTVEVWGTQMVSISGVPFHDISYLPGIYTPHTIDQLKLNDPEYMLVPFGMRSGNLGPLPLTGLPNQPQVGLSQGDEGPYPVDLSGILGLESIEELAQLIQTQIGVTNPAFKYIGVVGRSFKRNNLTVTELMFAGQKDLVFSATLEDPKTVEILKLRPGGRQASLSGSLIPFPIFGGVAPKVGVTVANDPFMAEFEHVPQNIRQAAQYFQSALRQAKINLPVFSKTRVFDLPHPINPSESQESQPMLYIQPGARGVRVRITAAPEDSTTFRALGLDKLGPNYAALSGSLLPFPLPAIGNSMTVTIGEETGDIRPPTGQIIVEESISQIEQAAEWLATSLHRQAIPGAPDESTWRETRVLVQDEQLLVIPGPWQPDPDFPSTQYGPIRFNTTNNDIGMLAYTLLLTNMVGVDVMRGRFGFSLLSRPNSPEVSYNYGFGGTIGAGPFYKPEFNRAELKSYPVGQNQTLRSLSAAIKAWDEEGRPQARILFTDNGLYREQAFELRLDDRDFLIIEAIAYTNPVLIATDPFQIQVGKGSAELNWHSLTIQGQLIYGGSGRLTSRFSYCNLLSLPKDEQGFSGDENAPVMVASSESSTISLTLDLCIVGPLRLPTYGLTLTIRDSILNPYGPNFENVEAIAGLNGTPGPETIIENATVFGQTHLYMLKQASNVIFDKRLTVRNSQIGIVRFCYIPPGSITPLRYRCQPDLSLANQDPSLPKPIFTSVIYPQPGFAQLASSCDPKISGGGANGGEMGAFNFLRQPNRDTILQQVLTANLPLGRNPKLFTIT